MATKAVPREQWDSFFDRFSEDHIEQSAALEIYGQAIGDQMITGEQVFRGISADLKDGENRISIQLGPQVEDGTSHSVSAPVAVSVKEGADEREASLEILAADGSSVLLRFVQSTLPA